MSYNWTKADTAEARERLKARLDSGERIILRSRNGSLSESWLSHDRVVSNTWTRGRYLFNPLILDFLACVSHAEYEFLDPVPACPPLRWVKVNAVYSANVFGAKFRCSPIETSDDDRWMAELFIGCRLVPVGDDNFETLEDAKSACEAIWASNWEQEMGRMQPWPES